jgi:hypothetical protein
MPKARPRLRVVGGWAAHLGISAEEKPKMKQVVGSFVVAALLGLAASAGAQDAYEQDLPLTQMKDRAEAIHPSFGGLFDLAQ